MRPIFKTETLDKMSPLIESFVKRLVEGIQVEADENGSVVDVKNWFYNFTFAVCLVFRLLKI